MDYIFDPCITSSNNTLIDDYRLTYTFMHLSACLLVNVVCIKNRIKTIKRATSKWTQMLQPDEWGTFPSSVSAFFRESLELSQTLTASVPLQEAVHTQKQAFVYFQLSPFKSHFVKARLVAVRRPFHHYG